MADNCEVKLFKVSIGGMEEVDHFYSMDQFNEHIEAHKSCCPKKHELKGKVLDVYDEFLVAFKSR